MNTLEIIYELLPGNSLSHISEVANASVYQVPEQDFKYRLQGGSNLKLWDW